MSDFSSGLDVWVASDFLALQGKRYGLLCNQATVTNKLIHILSLPNLPTPSVIFGPQHGLFGHQQDNMIEWQTGHHRRLDVPIFSLYGEVRKPKLEWLKDLDRMVIDVPNVGARYYTFQWTAALCVQACAEVGVPVTVLDRPNPLGTHCIGPSIEPGYESFVGLYSVPIQHGMTLGELLQYVLPEAEIEVIPFSGDDAQSYWVPPSPNMPTRATVEVYPGACLLEGTIVSEGRGTTSPFLQFGAPWVDAEVFCAEMEAMKIRGVQFLPTVFEPTFHKYGGQLCHGARVIPRPTLNYDFTPIQTYVAVIEVLYNTWKRVGSPPMQFVPGAGGAGAWAQEETSFWKSPPYEYETEKLPIDILWGSPNLRETIERLYA